MNTDSFLNDFLMILCRAIATRKLYFSNHVKIKDLTRQLSSQLIAYFRAVQDETLFIGVSGNNLIFKGRILAGPSITGGKLVALAQALQCGGFIFTRKITAEEIERFLDLSTTSLHSITTLEKAQELFKAHRITAIQLGHEYIQQSESSSEEYKRIWMGEDSSGGVFSPAPIYQALFDVVNNAYDSAGSDQVIDIYSAQSVSEYLLYHTRNNFCDIMQKIHYPDFDTYTVGHSVRVSALAVFVGLALGLPDKVLLQMGTAALLHDVGKAKVPGSIIHKNGKLSNEEFGIMKSHPVFGVEILLDHSHATLLDKAAAWGHHIRHDGKGYPEPSKWAFRHPITALLQVCDVFEALTSVRPYKKAKTPEEAYRIMLADTGGFHPGILSQFIRALGLYPPGNIVLLADGRKAKVTASGPKIDRPEIIITHDAEGAEYPNDKKEFCKLDQPQHAQLSIQSLILET